MDLDEFSCEGLTVTGDGAVLTALLDRPGGNPLSMSICVALTRLLSSPPEGAHILIIAAAGQSFCIGRDRGASDPSGLVAESDILIHLNQALVDSRLVTIARVQGNAGGFGAGLAALCDVTIAQRSASFFFPESKIGLAPAIVLGWLPQLVGRRAAFWLTATSMPVAGEQLLRLDLVNELVDDEAGMDAAVARSVGELSARKPRVHAEIKAMLRDFEGLATDKVYAMAGSRLVVGAQRREG